MPRTHEAAIRLQRAAWLTVAASLIFWAFFQISKSRIFAVVNPFADDPVDAIGSIFAIAITLASEMSAELQHPAWNESIWGMLLVIGLGVVALITCVAVLTTVSDARRLKAAQSSSLPDEAGSLGEALDDLWAFAQMILSWLSRRLPWLSRPLHWIDNVGNRLFEWVMNWPFIDPRSHPWRFCAAVALALGEAT